MEDVAAIFRVSVPTIHRWLRDARDGKNGFPLPTGTPGRKLAWNRDSIEEYLNDNKQSDTFPRLETATKLQSRHRAALADIEQNHGIKPKAKKEVK